MRALILLVVALAIPRVAAAQPVEAKPSVDLSVTGGAAAAALAVSFLPVDTTRRWRHELFGDLDRSVRGRYSATAAAYSDLLLASALAAPVFVEAGRGADDETGDRLLVYGETLALTAALTGATKYAVQRPRPYAYRGDARLRDDEGAHLSFYSGHAALAFAAATAGGYLYAAGSDQPGARSAVWFTGAAVASATAMLRVRAGKHFYSDILVGAAVGTALGFAVPRLHHAGGISLGAGEWAAIGGGLALGFAVAALAPLPDDVTVALEPLVLDGGGGLQLRGVLQ